MGGKIYIGNSGSSQYINGSVGIGTTNPQAALQVGTGVTVYGDVGIVSATSFYGSGAYLSDVLTTTGDSASIIDGNIVGMALSVSGICSATVFKGPNDGATEAVYYGDGQYLQGITADGVGAIGGLTVKNELGQTVGTAGSISTLDFKGAINVIANDGPSGVATMTVAGVATGIGTFIANPGVPNNLDDVLAWDSGAYAGPRVIDYTVHIIHDTGIHAQKVLVMQDTTNVYSNEYAVMHSTVNPIVSIAATFAIPTKTIYLAATPGAGVTGLTTYRVLRIGEEII